MDALTFSFSAFKTDTEIRILKKIQFKNTEMKKEEHSKHHNQQAQLVKVFGAMFIAFIFSYTPTIVLGFLAFILNFAFDGRVVPPPEVYTFAYVCFLSNPVSHPIIESSFVKDLRYEVTRVKSRIRRASSAAYHRTTQFVSPSGNSEASHAASNNGKPRSNSVALDSRPPLGPASKGLASVARKERVFSLVDPPREGSVQTASARTLCNGVQDCLLAVSEESQEGVGKAAVANEPV